MSIIEIMGLLWLLVTLYNINKKLAFYSSVIITNVFVAASLIVEALKVVPVP